MVRIAHREGSLSSPGRPNPNRPYRSSRKQNIVKGLNRLSSHDQGQFAVLWVDEQGEVTTEGSEAFRPYIEAWFVNIKPQAVEITLAAAAESRARKRSQVDQGEVKAEEGVTEGERSGDDGDEFGEDAEHEDIDGLQYIKTGHFDQGPQKHMLRFPGSLAPPPSLFSAEPPRERKRSLQTTKQHMPKKMRRSSIAKPLPVQRSDSESNAAASQGGISYKALTISDHEAVTTFFETRFRQMQQLTCKVVAKAWIKVIEPKKQSNFPYNRGEESKPSWWPEGARHKEPDHLMKPERLLLLMTMLRCRRVAISKLESATAEVSASIEECRIGLLEEIYRVAKMEERYVAGTLSHNTRCYVAASAEKIASSQKPHSPRVTGSVDGRETAPSTAGSTGSIGPGILASPEPNRVDHSDMQVRQTPRPSPTDSRPQPHPFSVSRSQPNIQPLHASMNFPTTFMPTTQPPGDEYLDSVQSPVGNYYYQRPSLSYGQPTTQTPLRRTSTVPQSQYSGWGMQVTNGLFSPYTGSPQPPQAHHNHPQNGAQAMAGSNPTTPVSNSFQPLSLLPPPLPTMHHNPLGPTHSSAEDRSSHYDTSRIASHMNHPGVTFSEFLESPIQERPYELGPVATSVGDEGLVSMGGGRGPDGSVIMPGTKEMPHG